MFKRLTSGCIVLALAGGCNKPAAVAVVQTPTSQPESETVKLQREALKLQKHDSIEKERLERIHRADDKYETRTKESLADLDSGRITPQIFEAHNESDLLIRNNERQSADAYAAKRAAE
jgi:hypothetical protein